MRAWVIRCAGRWQRRRLKPQRLRGVRGNLIVTKTLRRHDNWRSAHTEVSDARTYAVGITSTHRFDNFNLRIQILLVGLLLLFSPLHMLRQHCLSANVMM
jgi:hypothetical protein